jgi:HSP20 family protein
MQTTTRRLVYPGWTGPLHQARVWRPPTDVYETENELVVKVEIAGMRDGDFHVSLDDRRLTISGIRNSGVRERRAYYQIEVPSGEFQTEVELPVPIDPASVQAEYDDGYLRIMMSKMPIIQVTVREIE